METITIRPLVDPQVPRCMEALRGDGACYTLERTSDSVPWEVWRWISPDGTAVMIGEALTLEGCRALMDADDGTAPPTFLMA